MKKLSHGQLPTRKAKAHVTRERRTSSGSWTSVEESTYESVRYMPACWRSPAAQVEAPDVPWSRYLVFNATAGWARDTPVWVSPQTSRDRWLERVRDTSGAAPLELTAKCIMGAMGLRWKHVCDKIRKHSYAIQEGQYLMPPLEYPVFEPVYWPEYGRVCYVITYVLEKGGRRRKRTYR